MLLVLGSPRARTPGCESSLAPPELHGTEFTLSLPRGHCFLLSCTGDQAQGPVHAVSPGHVSIGLFSQEKESVQVKVFSKSDWCLVINTRYYYSMAGVSLCWKGRVNKNQAGRMGHCLLVCLGLVCLFVFRSRFFCSQAVLDSLCIEDWP